MWPVYVLLALSAACSESRHLPSPVAPSSTARTAGPQQSLYGYVANTAFSAVAGAKIEVVDGPQAGTSILSDSGGLFSYTGNFATPVTMRVSRDGYGVIEYCALQQDTSWRYDCRSSGASLADVTCSSARHQLTLMRR